MDQSRGLSPIDIPIGPFDEPPFELGRYVTAGFTADSEEIARATAAWLIKRLHSYGVRLGGHDYEIVSELSEDVGWDATQVVVGWVARAVTSDARIPPEA